MGLHRYVGLLAISLIIALPASAAETSSNAEQEVKAAIDKHVKALNDKHLKAVMATICPSPTAVSMGNSPEQTRVGTEQIAAHTVGSSLRLPLIFASLRLSWALVTPWDGLQRTARSQP